MRRSRKDEGGRTARNFGQDVIGKHGPQFARRSGQQEKMARAVSAQHRGGEVKSRRGPLRIGQDCGAGRNHGLARNAVGQGKPAAGKPFADAGENFFIRDERKSEQFGRSFAREVVAGRPEASGGQDKIGALEGGLESLADGRAIGHADLAGDADAARGEFAGQISEVGVGHETEEEFGSRIDHFGLHQPRTSRWLQRLSRA